MLVVGSIEMKMNRGIDGQGRNTQRRKKEVS